jgi:hypothetical protein
MGNEDDMEEYEWTAPHQNDNQSHHPVHQTMSLLKFHFNARRIDVCALLIALNDNLPLSGSRSFSPPSFRAGLIRFIHPLSRRRESNHHPELLKNSNGRPSMSVAGEASKGSCLIDKH